MFANRSTLAFRTACTTARPERSAQRWGARSGSTRLRTTSSPCPETSTAEILRGRYLLRKGRRGLTQHFAAASPPRPVLPGALGLGRIGLVARVAGVDLAERQRLDLAEGQGGRQGPGVARRVDGHPHHLRSEEH